MSSESEELRQLRKDLGGKLGEVVSELHDIKAALESLSKDYHETGSKAA